MAVFVFGSADLRKATTITRFFSVFTILQYSVLIVLLALNDFTHGMTLSFPEDSSEEVTRATTFQKCPNQTWYHNETQSCWPSKKQGPCPKSMVFFPLNQKYGDCDCPEVNEGTAWVYDVASDKCFKTYTQAFCASGEWLVFNGKHSLACIPNQCAEMERKSTPEEIEAHPMVLYKNKCARLMKSTKDNRCHSPYVLIINKDTGTPICSSEHIVNFDISVKGRFKCRPGTRRDILGKCRPLNTKLILLPVCMVVVLGWILTKCIVRTDVKWLVCVDHTSGIASAFYGT